MPLAPRWEWVCSNSSSRGRGSHWLDASLGRLESDWGGLPDRSTSRRAFPPRPVSSQVFRTARRRPRRTITCDRAGGSDTPIERRLHLPSYGLRGESYVVVLVFRYVSEAQAQTKPSGSPARRRADRQDRGRVGQSGQGRFLGVLMPLAEDPAHPFLLSVTSILLGSHPPIVSFLPELYDDLYYVHSL